MCVCLISASKIQTLNHPSAGVLSRGNQTSHTNTNKAVEMFCEMLYCHINFIPSSHPELPVLLHYSSNLKCIVVPRDYGDCPPPPSSDYVIIAPWWGCGAPGASGADEAWP